MAVRLERLEDQVLVITGGSSGIGLTTARLAVARGARVVLVARSEEALRQAAGELREAGGSVMYRVADVADAAALEAVAEATVREFGRFDTWVNNAGVGLYGRLEEIPLEDQRRLFDTDFWGAVNGCRAALPQLRRRGGALINVGSIASDVALPLQGIYVAAKHALKGYTDALRQELEEEGAPVSVTLVKPTSIATPFFEHARNYLDVEPNAPAPVYAPEAVARAILHCAEHPRRTVMVGGGARAFGTLATVAPRLADKVIERTMVDAQRTRRQRHSDHRDNLFGPTPGDARERGRVDRRVYPWSLYTGAVLHPARAALVAAGLGLAVAAGMRSLRRSTR